MNRQTSLLLSLAAVASGLTSLAAQTTPCVALNDASASVSNLITGRNSSAPGEWGWRYTPSSARTVHGLRIYTGNSFSDGFMKLAIWSHNPTTGEPDQMLGEGTFAAPKTATNGWVGTNLDRTVSMVVGNSYWIMWTEIGWATVPVDPNGTATLPAINRFGSANQWRQSSSPQALKCRLFCAPIDSQGVTAYGPACTGVNTNLGTSFTNTDPSLGNTDFRIEGTGLPVGQPAFLAVGVVSGWPSVSLGANAPGCFLNTDVALLLAGQTGIGDVRSSTARGHVRFNVGIPNNPALRGVFVSFQVAGRDPSANHALPLVFTNATQIVVF